MNVLSSFCPRFKGFLVHVFILIPHLQHRGDRFKDAWRQGEIEEPVARGHDFVFLI